MKTKKEISLLDIILLIVVFLLFDLVLIFYPAFPEKVFVAWLPTSGKPLILIKEIGIFVLPITILVTFAVLSLFSLFSTKEIRKKQFHSLKFLSTLSLLLLYLISILKNIKYIDISLPQTTAIFFFLISVTVGLLTILKVAKDSSFLFSQKLTDSLSSQFIVTLIEGIVMIIVGITVLNTFILHDWLKTIGFISFTSSVGYGFFFIYLLIIHTIQKKQEISSLLPEAPKEDLKKVAQREEEKVSITAQLSPIHQSAIIKQTTLDGVIMPTTAVSSLEKDKAVKKIKPKTSKKKAEEE